MLIKAPQHSAAPRKPPAAACHAINRGMRQRGRAWARWRQRPRPGPAQHLSDCQLHVPERLQRLRLHKPDWLGLEAILLAGKCSARVAGHDVKAL